MSWDSQLHEHLTSTKMCNAAALAQASDATFYAASAMEEGADPWTIVYADDHEQKVQGDDGNEKDVKINEATQLKNFVDTGKKPDGGLWFGGVKYNIVRSEENEPCGDDNTVFWALVAAPKKGVHIVKANTQILCGFYDEEKGLSSGNCKNAVLEFAKWLLSEGY
eukprot:TRINITY_DN27039_c0_g1_i1.p1 TRINITY_DN27039_c0_g1~~TRINITY_DN27039_c0_g1_i1.p1  ORF type:complete len:187 (+),score=45.93 TRINITY_DN27039_c0_g1_i1:67-561(+)